MHDMNIDPESPFDGNVIDTVLIEENHLASTEQTSQGTEMRKDIIALSPQMQEQIYVPWRSSVIIKVVGKSFGYKNLLTRLGGIWKPKGKFSMIDLGYDFFLVRFSILDDYQKALEQGPWFMGENYLSVRKWEPEFQAAKAKVSSMAVWIRLADLPIEFFHPIILRAVGNTIGTFLRIDTITTSVARGRFARICVQIDLEKPLMPNITIGKFIQKIQYENIPMLFYNCGILGHTQDKCNHSVSNTPLEDHA